MNSTSSHLTRTHHHRTYPGIAGQQTAAAELRRVGGAAHRRLVASAILLVGLALCIRLGPAATAAIALLLVALAAGTLTHRAGHRARISGRAAILLGCSTVLLFATFVEQQSLRPVAAVVRHPSARYATMLTTAYCVTGYTAARTWTRRGTIAATLPFGTRLLVPGYGAGVVLDRGGAVGPGHLDLYMSNCNQARAWGRRIVQVRLI